MAKNCDRGLENATRGRRPRAVFSRPRSQFFTIRTSQPANNIFLNISETCAGFPAITVPWLQTIKQTLTTSHNQLNLLTVTFLAILK